MSPEFTVLDVRGDEAWDEWTLENVAVTDGRVELEREPHPTYAVPERLGEDSLSGVSPVDVDADGCGAVYVLGADGTLHRTGPSADQFERLRCGDLSAGALRPTAFCLLPDTIFVAETTSPVDPDADPDRVEPNPGEDGVRGRLRALSAHLRQTRWTVDRADEVAFRRPTSVVAGPSAREVFVLDRGGDDGGFVAGVRDDGTARLVRSGLDGAVDLTVDARGDLYVLSSGDERSTLARHPGVASGSAPFPSTDGGGDGEGDEAEDGADRTATRTLPRAFDDAACLESVGDGGFVLGVGPGASGERTLLRYDYGERSFDRLTGYRGNCVRLRRADASGAGVGTPPSLYAIREPAADEADATDATATRLYRLDATETIRRADDEVRTAGSEPNDEYVGHLTERFDAGATQRRQYRLVLDVAAVPAGTQVTLWYATTATAAERPSWRPVPTPNRTALLMPSAGGRYLWLRLSLVGTRYDSPAVEGLRLTYGHDSYVRYLPSIYAESDPPSVYAGNGESDLRSVHAENAENVTREPIGSFLERFLAVFESAFSEVDVELAGFTRYLDPRSAPETGLSWLGGWLGVARDDSWSERSKRLLIAEAPTLFKQRGTRRGLRRMLDIYLAGVTAPSPVRIADAGGGTEGATRDGDDGARGGPSGRSGAENRGGPGTAEPRGDGWNDECDGGSDAATHDHFVAIFEFDDIRDCIDGDDDAVGPFEALVSCPQEFVVLVGPTLDSDARATVERIVDAERPAHAAGRVVFLPRLARLGEHAHLGVNTQLPSRDFVVGETELGGNAVLVERDPGAQLGWKARLGEDLELS